MNDYRRELEKVREAIDAVLVSLDGLVASLECVSKTIHDDLLADPVGCVDFPHRVSTKKPDASRQPGTGEGNDYFGNHT